MCNTLPRYLHQLETFFPAVLTMQVCKSSLHDLLDLSINPCVCGVLGAPCLMVMPLFRQNVSMFLLQNSLPLRKEDGRKVGTGNFS